MVTACDGDNWRLYSHITLSLWAGGEGGEWREVSRRGWGYQIANSAFSVRWCLATFTRWQLLTASTKLPKVSHDKWVLGEEWGFTNWLRFPTLFGLHEFKTEIWRRSSPKLLISPPPLWFHLTSPLSGTNPPTCAGKVAVLDQKLSKRLPESPQIM